MRYYLFSTINLCYMVMWQYLKYQLCSLIQAALGLNIKYKEISALTGEGVEDVSFIVVMSHH